LLDKLGGIAVQPEALTWLLTPCRFKAELLTRIENAKNSIYIAALYLEDDEAGREILQALMTAKAKNPALDIKILVDFHRARRGLIGHKGDSGNYLMYRKVMAEAEYPIEIMGVPVKSREFMGVLHLKGFVIDDAVIYSGASLNNIYLQQNDKYRFDRYHVIESAELARSMRAMIQRYIIADPAVTSLTQDAQQEVLPPKTDVRSFKLRLSQAQYEFNATRTGNRVTPLLGLGRKHNLLNKAVIAMVEESKDRLFICTPYFNPPYILVRALAKHLRNGKRIDIVVGDKTANDFYIPPTQEFKTIGGLPYLYELNLRRFAKINEANIASRKLSIHLWKDGDNSFHLKGIWVDKRYMLITGNNLNPRAWKLDLENAILITDDYHHLTERFEQEVQNILQHTQLVCTYKQIEKLENYPETVQRLIRKITRVKADRVLKQIL